MALLRSVLTLEYDAGVSQGTADNILELLSRPSLTVEKKGKNGVVEQDIISMLRSFNVTQTNREVVIEILACCQNPTLNPMQVVAAVEKYLPERRPDHARCRRVEVYDTNETVFR